MNTDQFLPDEATVAAIEKDIATYNQRREVEHKALERREPIVMMSYAVGVAFLAYLAYRLFSHSASWYMPSLFIGAVGIGSWSRVQKWARRDAEWTQQNFRDHIVPVMLGFVPQLRYSHGINPRSFAHIPKQLLPAHNHSEFDDVLSANLDGRRFELFEAKLVQRSKNSEQIMFQGAILSCKRPEAFRGLLVATHRTGEFRRFLRDLFGSGGLNELTVTRNGLGQIYEFRTDNRGAAQKLLSGGAADLLLAISKIWRRETPQIAFSGEDVFILLPSTQNFFELPSIDRGVSYRAHIEPMARQFSTFLAIVREIGMLDAVAEEVSPPPVSVEPAAVQDREPPAEPPLGLDGKPFVPLLDGGEPPTKTE